MLPLMEKLFLSAPSWVSYEPQAIIGRNKVHWIETQEKIIGFQLQHNLKKKLNLLIKKI